LLLVPEDDGQDAARADRTGGLRAAVCGIQRDLLAAVRARAPRHAATDRGLSARDRLRDAEPRVLARRGGDDRRRAALPLGRLVVPTKRNACGGRSVGRSLAGVGHDLAAAAPQLRAGSPDPLRATGVRPQASGARAVRIWG